MKQYFTCIFIAVVFCSLATPVFSQATYTFSTAGNWGTASNWAGGVLPPNGFASNNHIIINANCVLDIPFGVNTSSFTVNSGVTFTINAGQGILFQSEAEKTNNGTIINNGNFQNTSFLTNNGVITNNSSGFFSSGVDNYGTNSNAGTMTIWGDNFSSVNNSGDFNIINGIGTGFYMRTGSSITNTGTINIGGGFIFGIDAVFPGGTVNWISGNVSLYADLTLTLNTPLTIPVSSNLIAFGGTLVNNSTLQINGTLRVDPGGIITNNSTIDLNDGGFFEMRTNPAVLPGGTFNWNTGGALVVHSTQYTVNSPFTIPSGRLFYVTNSALLKNNSTLTNQGTLTIFSGTLTNDGTFVNDATFTNGGTCTNNVTITNNSSFTNNSLVTNNGTLHNSATLTSGLGPNIRIVNNGTLSNTSALSVGRLINNAGGIINNTGQFTINQYLNTQHTMLGTFNLNAGGNLILNSALLTLTSGTFNWNSPSTVTIAANSTNGITSGPLTIPLGCTLDILSGATFQIQNVLTLNGAISGTGSLNLQSPGNFVIPITTTLTPLLSWVTGTLTITSTGVLTLNNPLTTPSTSTLTVNAGGTLVNNSSFRNASTFTNNGTVQNSASFWNNSSGTATNNGTFVNQATGDFYNRLFFVNNGVFIDNGTMGNEFVVNNNGTIKGEGVITNDNIFNNNTGSFIAPGQSTGTLTGTLTSRPDLGNGTYICEIDGTSAGDFDVFAITTGTNLTSASLQVVWGFTPAIGNSFTILTANSLTGTFASVHIPPVSGRSFAVQYTTTSVIIVVSASFPVELTDFSAKALEKTVRLDWTTATETHNKGFFVERSADGERWQSLGFVAGQGNSIASVSYSFLDEKPFPGINYYRLLQVDFDGRETFSAIVPVTLEDRPGKLAIYPNPVAAGGECLITYPFSDEETAVFLRILDANGRQVAISNDAKRLNTTDLQPGVYWLEVRSDLGYSVGKLVVQ